MKLSTGKELTFTALDNGALEIDQELTENEWQEYCAIKKQCAQVPTLEYCKIHLQNNTYILDKKRESRVMRLFVLSSGYIACFNSEADLDYWGGDVIPLAFGSEVSTQRAIDIMQSANPHNLVSFAGGYNEYKNYISR